MTENLEKLSLSTLSFSSYIDNKGFINDGLDGKIGVYAIFNQDKILEYVGYSRNLLLSLKQHLVRQPENCYWFKTHIIDRPSRSILEEIKQSWIAENQSIPLGNGENETLWNQPIDTKTTMTEQEKETYNSLEEIAQIKFLKKIARHQEEIIKTALEKRGVKFEVRFNPKLKEQGLLDLK
ncbi:hypothetical protein Cyast_0489 [Cyanobacterium stanieri PCC 7202]|uniref:GIY-YIG domain-containing protein n=1 Tax=Cyanobacterium stanieri (strain ATCC 29140 / PCC 7202) TaxID=292563 RepID=K9YK27_CYASC|nr:hypothetical protein Cyast_0489 [Cyanobacterium stanieri PCC 7202]